MRIGFLIACKADAFCCLYESSLQSIEPKINGAEFLTIKDDGIYRFMYEISEEIKMVVTEKREVLMEFILA